jgi:predicted AAA+ superfamily ATPase
MRLREIQNRLLAYLPEPVRPFFADLVVDDRGALVVGPRGVGKTCFLLRSIRDRHGLYVSLDNPIARTVPLYDLVEGAALAGYEAVFLDEVHFAEDWSSQLKAAYDSFPNLTLWATDSSAIVLRRGIADLSRRFPVIRVPLLSFREYVNLRSNTQLPMLDPFDLDPDSCAKVFRAHNVLRLFSEYTRFGFRPMFTEGTERYLDKLVNTINKSVESDIPYLLPQLSDNHFRLMQAVITYLATSSLPRISVNSLCKKWRVGKDKLYQLLDAMQRAFLIRTVRRRSDTSVSSIGAKMFLCEPAAYGYFTDAVGTRREAFVAAFAEESGHSLYATKDERQGDFLVDEHTVEVGGRAKRLKGADYVIRDDVDLPNEKIIPMWTLWMEY